MVVIGGVVGAGSWEGKWFLVWEGRLVIFGHSIGSKDRSYYWVQIAKLWAYKKQ